NGGGTVGCGLLSEQSGAVCANDVPGKVKLIGAVGENSSAGWHCDGGIGERRAASGRSDALKGSVAVKNERASGEGDGGGGGGAAEVDGRDRNRIAPGVDDGGDGGCGIGAIRSSARAPSGVGGTRTRTPYGETGGAWDRCREINCAATGVDCSGIGVNLSSRAITARNAGSRGIGVVAVDGIHQIRRGFRKSSADINVIASGAGRGGGRKGVGL